MEGYQRTLDRTRQYLRATDKVLELGCGTGSTALKLASQSIGKEPGATGFWSRQKPAPRHPERLHDCNHVALSGADLMMRSSLE